MNKSRKIVFNKINIVKEFDRELGKEVDNILRVFGVYDMNRYDKLFETDVDYRDLEFIEIQIGDAAIVIKDDMGVAEMDIGLVDCELKLKVDIKLFSEMLEDVGLLELFYGVPKHRSRSLFRAKNSILTKEDAKIITDKANEYLARNKDCTPKRDMLIWLEAHVYRAVISCKCPIIRFASID